MNINFTIKGQARGGKNHVNITKTGHRYPNPVFAKWRNDAIAQIRAQWPQISITWPCKVIVQYWAGDKRKRDVPALLDGLFHVLERGDFIKDDYLIQEVHWIPKEIDRSNPKVIIIIGEKI